MDYTSNRLLTIRQVMAIASIKSRTTIYNYIRRQTFPKPCYIGEGVPRWRESEVIAWTESLPCEWRSDGSQGSVQ